jgi:uncharacterized protein YgiM (DUF1202 family)
MRVHQRFVLALLPFLVLCLALLACGGFQLRPAATPALATAMPLPTETSAPTLAPTVEASPTLALQPTVAPTATAGAGGLAVGGQAQVSATLINVRTDASASANQVGQLSAGTVVTVTGGPVQADDFTWYKVDDGAGTTGWVALGPPDSPWLEPQASGPAQATAVPAAGGGAGGLAVGGQAQVTATLINVHSDASASASQVGQLSEGTVVTVTGGPVQADDFTWYKVDDGSGTTGWVALGPPDSPWLAPQASSTTPPAQATALPSAQPTAVPSAQPTAVPTAQATAGPAAGAGAGGLAIGSQAQVTATLINVHSDASTSANQVGQLSAGTVVTVTDGPEQADNLTWYKVDNGAGTTGWVALGPPDSPWLMPQANGTPAPTAAGPHLVDRAIKVGDIVQVTTQDGQLLTVRSDAGADADAIAKAEAGTQFTVVDGPVQKDNLTWWEISGDQYKGWAAEGDGQTRWLTPVEH